jgi:hypothetical protein
MKIGNDVSVNKLDSLIETESEEVNTIDSVSEFENEDSDDLFEYDPSFQKRFINSTSNEESQNKAISFDYINLSEEVYEIVVRIVGSTEFSKDKSKNNSVLYEQVNKNFSKVVKEIIQDQKKKKFPGIISIAFIQFSEYISSLTPEGKPELTYYDVFHAMNEKFQNFIKRELIQMIGADSYRKAEKRAQAELKPSIDNHFDAIIKKISF